MGSLSALMGRKILSLHFNQYFITNLLLKCFMDVKYHTLNISRAAITYQHLFERKITKMAVLYFEETNRACGTVCRTCMLCEGITRRINGICAMCKVTWVYGRSYPGYRVLCLIGKEMPCKYMYLPN